MERDASAVHDRLLGIVLDHGVRAIAVLDGHGRLRHASPPARHLLGADADSLRGRQLGDWFAPSEWPRWQALLRGGADTGEATWTLGAPGGRRVLMHYRRVRAPGDAAMLVVTLEDAAEVSLSVDEREQLAALAEAITRGESLRRIHRRAVDLLAERLPQAAIALTRRQHSVLTLTCSRGIPRRARRVIGRQPLSQEESPAVAAALTNAPCIVEDVGADSRWRHRAPAARRYGVRAVWAFPLPGDEGPEAIGTVAVYLAQARGPTDSEAALLREVAQLVALATHRRIRLGELRYRAFHDVLTGLANRQLLEDRLDQALAVARRDGANVAVLMIDLDDFKPINDQYGHSLGDTVLVEVASRLRERRRPGDTVARLGGDEFVIVLPDTDGGGAETVAHDVMHRLREPMALGGVTARVTPSIGVAVADRGAATAAELLRLADAGMYRIKTGGKAGVGRERAAAVPTVRPIQPPDIDTDHLAAHMSVETVGRADREHRLVAVRLALHWHHPEHGRLPLDQLLRLLEARGLRAAGETAAALALRDSAVGAAIARSGTRAVYAPSGLSLSDEDFPVRLAEYVAGQNLAPNDLEVDVTAAFGETESAARIADLARRLRAALPHVRLAARELGQRDLPVPLLAALAPDTLVIAPTLLHACDPGALAATVALGRSLAPVVVAGGVATLEEHRRALEAGVDATEGPLHTLDPGSPAPGAGPATD